MLEHFPLRHIDRTAVSKIRDINFLTEYIQVAGELKHIEMIGENWNKRMVAYLKDETAELELVWFKGASWIQKSLKEGSRYLVYGKVGFFNGSAQITHPEIELLTNNAADGKPFLEPIYPTTEKLKVKGLNARQIGKLTYALVNLISEKDIPEILPQNIIENLSLMPRYTAMVQVHFPKSDAFFAAAIHRLKFEELFIAQVRLNMVRIDRQRRSSGVIFSKVGELFHNFYKNHLPFKLTNAQKRVLREIRNDTASGHQMNRLLQGDVGSGKTIVAVMSALFAADNGYQSCLMAPTEVLAQQHFDSISDLLKHAGIQIRLLTGSTKTAERKEILSGLLNGSIHLIIGTHALIENTVKFFQLGLVIVDEQHRFGVAQRARLWEKAAIPPHILVMTATPIPRTLAMTVYGDLDYSILDELPPGRQVITTVNRNEMQRAAVMDFVRSEIEKGRQAFIIYPLIDESETLSYENLMKGYEQVKSYFPEPAYYISMVHGKMNTEQKEINMRRFLEKDTQIMVATTVIEVGINVPNASVMVIESAEKFGLSQLHQLRGRVGRGSSKSYCILLTPYKISKEAKERINTLCSTNDGFKIAERDLELRGPGSIDGTKQSGLLNFKLASIVNDKSLLDLAKKYAEYTVAADDKLEQPGNLNLKNYLVLQKGKTVWSKIS